MLLLTRMKYWLYGILYTAYTCTAQNILYFGETCLSTVTGPRTGNLVVKFNLSNPLVADITFPSPVKLSEGEIDYGKVTFVLDIVINGKSENLLFDYMIEKKETEIKMKNIDFSNYCANTIMLEGSISEDQLTVQVNNLHKAYESIALNK